jgi:hypothetical protein
VRHATGPAHALQNFALLSGVRSSLREQALKAWIAPDLSERWITLQEVPPPPAVGARESFQCLDGFFIPLQQRKGDSAMIFQLVLAVMDSLALAQLE